jgi:heptosyltransferase-1
MKPKHLLLIRTSAFGDIVQTFYVLSDIHRALPETRLTWCVDARFADLARLHPAVAHVITLPTRRWRGFLFKPWLWPEIRRWIRQLRDFPFDASVDLQGLYKSAIVGWMSRATSRFGPEEFAVSESGVQRLYSHQVKGSKVEGLAMRARYFAGAALGFEALSYPMDSGIRRWPQGTGGQQILCMIGASRAEKMWPKTSWAELCLELSRQENVSIELLWGSESERDLAREIQSQSSSDAVIVAPRIYDVQDLVARFVNARAVVGGDTGLAHLAVALGVPTVMLFLKTHAVRYAHPELSNQLPVDIADGPVSVARVFAQTQKALGMPAADPPPP